MTGFEINLIFWCIAAAWGFFSRPLFDIGAGDFIWWIVLSGIVVVQGVAIYFN